MVGSSTALRPFSSSVEYSPVRLLLISEFSAMKVIKFV